MIMSAGIIRKSLTIVVLLLVTPVCAIMAEDVNSPSFDPFRGESNALARNKKLASGPIIPQVEFNNNDISMVFQIISDATGWSLFPTADVSKAKISLWAKNITAEELLDTVITMAGFIYYRQGDTITIMTNEEYMRFHGLAKKVFKLKFATAVSIDAVIKPFLTKVAKSVVHQETNTIVLYETDANQEFIAAVIEKLDTPSEDIVLEVIDLKYADSELVAEKLQQLFADENLKTQNIGNNRQASEMDGSKEKINEAKINTGHGILIPKSRICIQSIGRTNQLVVTASRADVERLKQLIEKLDTHVEPLTQNYQFTYVNASEIFTGLENILNLNRTNTGQKDRSRQVQGLNLIEKTNSILLTGPPSTHRIMTSIVESLDKPGTYEAGIIRIYKLENADVEEVAKIISEILETDSEEKDSSSKVKFSQKTTTDSQVPSAASLAKSEEFVPQIEARVSISKSTNSIVVQATTRQHRELEKLIEELDTRRRQVLIEATIVELTNTDNLSLGVELSRAEGDIISFTAFGLSTNLAPTVGTRDITISPGGTAAVLRPDKIQVILRALKEDGRAKITSAPRILVNDNAVGFINSIAEEPTTQTNQGEATTITSFGGFVEAGTQFRYKAHRPFNTTAKKY